MFPSFPSAYPANGAAANVVLFGGLDLCTAPTRALDANATSDLLGQFRSSYGTPSRSDFGTCPRSVLITERACGRMQTQSLRVPFCLSAFAHAIVSIVLGRSLKQMLAATARRIIAVVTYPQGTGIVSVLQEVCNAMCLQFVVGDAEATVSPDIDASGPFPALALRTLARSLVHGTPKTFYGFLRECGDWFKIGSSHIISFSDGLVRAAFGVRAPWRLALIVAQETQ